MKSSHGPPSERQHIERRFPARAHIVLLVLALVGGTPVGCQTTMRSTTPPAAPLEGTAWTLVELDGKPFVLSQGLQTPTLTLDAAAKGVSGVSGINRFAGGYELQGERLKFGPLMGTRMAGPPEAMAAESAFLAAIEQTGAWRITGTTLDLLRADGHVLARFTSPEK